MNKSPHNQTGPSDSDLPERLVTDLQTSYRTATDVPRELDETILAAARTRLQTGRESTAASRWVDWLAALRAAWQWQPAARWSFATGAALLLLAAVLIDLEAPRVPGGTDAITAIVREDLDGNGRVNIADAFLLARALENHAPYRHQWDMNGDGRVGREDVDAIAAVAVNLDRSRWP